MNPQMMVLQIQFDPTTQQVSVNGSIDQTGTCYMMLELAKDIIRQHAATARSSLIARPNEAFPPLTLDRS